jgi:glycosyltransferase involved in cell wall biosynthesis
MMKRKRIAVLTTHPIQYQAPWFRAMAAHPRLDLQVFFCHQATQAEQSSAGFGVEFDWDVPLLDGYNSRFLKNVAKYPTIGAFAGLDTPEITDIIRRESYDALIVNGWHFKSAWQAFRACWKSGTPVMARGDSTLYNQRARLKKIVKWPYYHWFIRKLDACLAVGKWSREYYLHYGARADRVFLVPHVIDDEFFARASLSLNPERAAIRKEWELDEDAAVYLFSGKFIDVKRPMDFVRAIERAAGSGLNIMGLMAGDGPLRRTCEEYAEHNRVPVKFAGFLNQSQIVRAYVACDALVLGSVSETWGMVVNEAMACGRPCLISDQVGCGPDMIVSGETGDIFPVGDIEAMSALFIRYAGERARLEAMRGKALEMARRYSVGVAVEGVLNAVEALNGVKR